MISGPDTVYYEKDSLVDNLRLMIGLRFTFSYRILAAFGFNADLTGVSETVALGSLS
jgi:hypothetical protein